MTIEVPELTHGCNSWIIEDLRTGKAVIELFNVKNVRKVLAAGPTIYKAHTALAWLQALNGAPKNTKSMGECEMVRIHYTDPDYRRSPKTACYCAVCQRDIRDVAKATRVILWGDELSHIVHPADATSNDMPALIGPECAKEIPAEFIVR